MKNGTLLRIVGLAVLAAIGVTLFYKGTAIFGQPGANRLLVYAIFKMGASNAFWRSVRDGAVSAAEDEHIDLKIRGPQDETNVDEQIRILDEAIADRPNAIVLAAADYNRLSPGVKKATAQGIPVITIDSFVDTADAVCKIGTDNQEAGRSCARAVLAQLSPGSMVAVMSYIKGSSSALDRERGCTEILASSFRLLPTQYGDSDSEKSYQQTLEILRAHPDLGGIVALNEPTIIGVARALRESGRAKRIVLVGFDNSFEILKYVEEGIIRDTIVQQPFNMGYLGVATVRKVLAGIRVEPFRDTGSIDINRANMFLPQNQKLLFPVSDIVK